MKKALENSLHSQLKTFLFLSEDCIIILDSNYCIIDFNEATKSFLNWKEHEMIGKPFAFIYSDHFRFNKIPFPYSKYEAMRRGEWSNFNYIMYRNNTKRYMTWKCAAQPDQSLFIIWGKDNTDKKRLALQNITIFDQIKKISACVPGNFYWKNKNAQYLGCNQTLLQTLGFASVNELVGKTDFDLWFEYAESLKKNDELVIKEKKPIFFEETVMLNGKKMFFTVIKMPLLDDEGNIIGILGNSLDITELKKAQDDLPVAKEAAAAASHAKTEFIANMSHDIRTPLTGVVGMSKLLEDNVHDINQKQYAHWLGESGKQLLHMLNGILDLISADNLNEKDLHEEPFNLHEVIDDIVQLERPSMLVKGLELVTVVDKAIPPCLISDITKIHRVLVNLLGNAIKFTQEGRVGIHVSLLEKSNTHVLVHFRITDTGIGIPNELQAKVFDRFYRIIPSNKGTYTGHGIGLHIVQSYVELLGGEISLKSELGLGTTFCFDLSLKIGEGTVLKNFPTRPTNPLIDKAPVNYALPVLIEKNHTLEKPKLLLVEDNKIALFTLENLISQSQCQFTSVMDGEAALQLAQTQSFDLIITDLGLPGLSGSDLTSKIRAFEKEKNKPAIPIIGLTAHSEERIKKSCLQSGMNEVYTKPMTLEVLSRIKNTYFMALNEFIPFAKTEESNSSY
ncbi:ATP-binding protein [Legionella sp.]|uniref:PAS domain-containing sensor histidine kinase n=1 Tax=Legionella sp. TaxID=459 RepID=UPI003C8EEFBF